MGAPTPLLEQEVAYGGRRSATSSAFCAMPGRRGRAVARTHRDSRLAGLNDNIKAMTRARERALPRARGRSLRRSEGRYAGERRATADGAVVGDQDARANLKAGVRYLDKYALAPKIVASAGRSVAVGRCRPR